MLLATALFAWAIWAQLTSRTVQILTNREKDSVHLSVLTSPAMDIAYNPATRKAAISVRAETCPPHNCKPLNRAKFFTPEITGREEAWNTFKEALNNWRYNPLIIGQAVWAYITAWHDKRTDLTPAEFALISLELTQLEAADFALIVDYSGRLVQVKQLSRAIGINGEIKTESSTNVICDTRIILGKDFEMPL